MKTPPLRSGVTRALSLLEVTLVVGLLAIIGSLSFTMVSDVVSTAKNEKLSSDIAAINRSVGVFLGTGGDLSNAANADEVLAALKKTLSNASKNPSLSGAALDPRLKIEYQSTAEASGKARRAYWNSQTQKFEITTSGQVPGIKSIYLDDQAGEMDPGTREGSFAFQYASENEWIWDYTEVNAPAPLGPTVVPVTSVPAPTTPPVIPPTPPTPVPSTVLTLPSFSIPGGDYPITDFGLSLTLTNPNPAGSSSLYYSVNYGEWLPYSGLVTVAPDSHIAAMAVANSAQYESSAQANHQYAATPIPLNIPIISPSRPDFGLFTGRNIRIEITNPNPAGISILEYRVGGDPWQIYTDAFRISRNDYPSGVMIQARVTPLAPYYTGSGRTLRTLGIETATIAGTSVGTFHGAVGAPEMVATSTGNAFSWGRDYWTADELATFLDPADVPVLSKSTMDFQALSYDMIETGERFNVGSLSYYNGTVVNLTGADQVSFAVDLNFNVGGYSASSSFNFDFALLNTINYLDPNDPWADADFVRLLNPLAEETLNINGIEFQLLLEFGETTANGLATFDEFHVLEGKTAETQLYGTLVEVGTLNFND